MKKLLIGILAVMTIFSLVGCGNKEQQVSDVKPSETQTSNVQGEIKIDNRYAITKDELQNMQYNILDNNSIVNSVFILESDGAFVELNCNSEEDEEFYKLNVKIGEKEINDFITSEGLSGIKNIGVCDLDENDTKKELILLDDSSEDDKIYIFEIEKDGLREIYEETI